MILRIFIPVAALALAWFASMGRSNKAPTFSHDVAPILYRRCTTCHSERSIAPFSLIGYENARQYASTIAAVTQSGVMPPWKAAEGYGEFRDVARLSDSEKRTLATWAAAGAPRGDPKEEPQPVRAADGWQLGRPDLVVTTRQPCKIPPEGGDFYRDYLVTGTYDNSNTNPRNPNKTPKVVESGPSSKGEMLLLDLYVVEKPEPEPVKK